MKSEWICHPKGAEKILRISERYFASRRNHYSDLFPELPALEYCPWMSRPALANELLRTGGKLPRVNSKPFPGKDYIDRFCTIYSTFLSEGTFSPEEPSRPFADLYDTISGALEEQQYAFDFIINSDTWMSVLADSLIFEIMPLAVDGKPYNGLGGVSDPALIGTVFLGKMVGPFARVNSIISLAHELGHQALMILQTIDNIAGKHKDALVYSSVREVERPFLHSLHAAIALVYMIESGRLILERDSSLTTDEKAYLEQLQLTHKDALSKGYKFLIDFDLSPIGNEVLKDVGNLVGV